MRRILVLLAGLGVLPAITGCVHTGCGYDDGCGGGYGGCGRGGKGGWCQHTGGKCDCAPPVQPCCIYGLYPAEAHVPAPPVPPPPGHVAEPPVAIPVKERLGMPRGGL
jgi:hypothetical protein